MPIYEYQCSNCGHSLEALQKIADAPLSACPQCGKEKLQKLVSAASFRLKGGGWYETDFKKTGQKRLADNADNAEKKPADAKPETTESKKPDKSPTVKTAEAPKPSAASSKKE